MAAARNDSSQQRAKFSFQSSVSRYPYALSLPAHAKESDEIVIKTVPPTIGIETGNDGRQPSDRGNEEA